MHDLPQRWVLIIPAAGKGLRYGATATAKQFVQVAGRSLLAHTVGTALSIANITSIVIAVSEDSMVSTRELLIRECSYSTAGSLRNGGTLDERINLVAGGTSRQESVARALDTIALGASDLVFVHDAVRPLASAELYARVGQAASTHGAAVPCLALSDTIKEVRNGVVVSTPARNLYRRVQTPQAFSPAILIAAHAHAIEHDIQGTDDASLVEHLGVSIFCVDGEETNMKVTTPSDLRLVEWIMSSKS